jgi:hypothetical protein
MPNFDGGHYFLTTLLPIGGSDADPGPNVGPGPDAHDPAGPSPAHRVREALSVLPKARQTRSSLKTRRDDGPNSPFARSLRTHFARFVVIDDVIFNGRESMNALRVAADRERLNPTIHGPSDQLSCPYLLFSADFDAASGDLSELRSYLAELWAVMEPELRSVLRHCRGFGQVRDASGFADYVIRGQIETTMPFNDYWRDGAPFLPKPGADTERKPFPWRALAAVVGTIVGAGVLMAGLDALFGASSWGSAVLKVLLGVAATLGALTIAAPLLDWFGVRLSLAQLLWVAAWVLAVAVLFLAWQTSLTLGLRPERMPPVANAVLSVLASAAIIGLAVAAALAAARAVLVRRGAKPFPAAPDSDLRSILKALYLQQRFQEFAIDAQGRGDVALHAEFGRFLADYKPADLDAPTQRPGVVRSPA